MSADIFGEVMVLVVVLIIISLGGYDIYLHVKLGECESQILAYEVQMDTLKSESEAEHNRVKEAESIAKQQLKQALNRDREILTTSIGSTCPDAIAWGIKQAKSF